MQVNMLDAKQDSNSIDSWAENFQGVVMMVKKAYLVMGTSGLVRRMLQIMRLRCQRAEARVYCTTIVARTCSLCVLSGLHRRVRRKRGVSDYLIIQDTKYCFSKKNRHRSVFFVIPTIFSICSCIISRNVYSDERRRFAS